MSGEAMISHIPAHDPPAWISSEDVLAEIRKLAEQGADKAVCWDMTQAVYRIVLRGRLYVPAGLGLSDAPEANG